MNAVTELKNLMAAGRRAWNAANKAGVCPTNDRAWQAAADAERAHRETHGWDHASTGIRNFKPCGF